MDSLIIAAQKPREFLTDAASPHVDFISGSYKMVLKRGQEGKRNEGEETRGEKNGVVKRPGGAREKGKMPAGKQMVAPFIGLFVGSAMTFCPAMKQAEILLVLESIKQRGYNCSSY